MTYTLTIDGDAVESEETFDVINPATEEVLAAAPQATAAHVERAVTAAERAFQPSWTDDDALRRSLLTKAAEALLSAVDEVAPVLTAEQGKPIGDAEREVRITAERFSYAASLEMPTDVVQDDDVALVKVTRRPIGPTLAIAPWNSPLVTGAGKVAPALRAGNTVILKPSPFTPLSTLMVGEILRGIFPPGTVNVLSGQEPLGQSLTAARGIRKISLTGSVPTGRVVGTAAMQDFKRVTLELGGNDAAIVLPDADPAEVAPKLFAAAFANCGQVCVAVKRLYVPRALHDELVEHLVGLAGALVVGDGSDRTTQMGPLTNESQLAWVEQLVEEAVASGATVAHGGQRIKRPGYFYTPTIVTGARRGMNLVDLEQFGPALPVIPYDDVDDAIEQANSTEVGLGGSVWTRDLERGREISRRLEAGTVWINAHRVLAAHQPFGGLKSSGLGVHAGLLGMLEFTDVQVVRESRE